MPSNADSATVQGNVGWTIYSVGDWTLGELSPYGGASRGIAFHELCPVPGNCGKAVEFMLRNSMDKLGGQQFPTDLPVMQIRIEMGGELFGDPVNVEASVLSQPNAINLGRLLAKEIDNPKLSRTQTRRRNDKASRHSGSLHGLEVFILLPRLHHHGRITLHVSDDLLEAKLITECEKKLQRKSTVQILNEIQDIATEILEPGGDLQVVDAKFSFSVERFGKADVSVTVGSIDGNGHGTPKDTSGTASTNIVSKFWDEVQYGYEIHLRDTKQPLPNIFAIGRMYEVELIGKKRNPV